MSTVKMLRAALLMGVGVMLLPLAVRAQDASATGAGSGETAGEDGVSVECWGG